MKRNKSSLEIKSKMKRKDYEKELQRLQAELCILQEWVKYKGLRVIIVFEGRDGAGKGGTIKAITERVSPRVFRLVALPAPSDREKTQMYIQRYLPHFPAAGEIVIFDRSWYNRAGVEYVMGFCTEKQHRDFLERCPMLEQFVEANGIQLIKYWLEVSNEEQARRFQARIDDPLRQWKLSPVDLPSRSRCVRLLPCTRHDVGCHRYGFRTVAHCAIRRQETSASQLHLASVKHHSLQKGAERKGETARPFEERRIRRRGLASKPTVYPGKILNQSAIFSRWSNHRGRYDCSTRGTLTPLGVIQ